MVASSMAGEFVRRGLELSNLVKGSGSGEPVQPRIPTWAIVMLTGTFGVFFFAMTMIEYTFGRVVPTLLMIESPQEVINFEPLPTDDTDASLNKNPEIESLRPNFITSSFRSSVKLLQSKGGFRARFRGFSIFVITQFVASGLSNMFKVAILPTPVANITAAVLCAQLSLAWTQIVISEPSPKSWFRRIPGMKMWKKVAIPTAALALAKQISLFIPVYIGTAAGLMKTPEELQNISRKELLSIVGIGSGLYILAMILSLCLVFPANVVLTRVQASLLSDAEETIVPFDRSFGGKVIPEIVGGSGVVGMLDAWKTFDWSARVRLVKAYAKVFAMQIALGTVMVLVLAIQLSFVIPWEQLSGGEKSIDNRRSM